MGDKSGKYFVFLFALATIRFFSPALIPAKVFIYFYDLLFLLTIIYVMLFIKREHSNKFGFPVFLLIVSIFVSCISAYVTWGQGFFLTFKSITYSLSYVLFFLILVLNVKIADLEKFIVIVGVVFMGVYFISFIAYPNEIFRYRFSVPGLQRGFQRIVPFGIGYMFLLSFYSLNRYFDDKKLKWLILYLLTLVFTVMTLTRTLIAVSFSLSALFILRKSSNLKKIIALVIIGLSVFYISQIKYFQQMSELTQEQGRNWESYIRVRAAKYYLTKFSPDLFTKIFGNGNPTGDSAYDNYVENQLEKKHGYFLSDLGYIGIYVVFGFFSVLALAMIIFRVIKTPVGERYLYTKYFLFFVFVTDVIIGVLFTSDYIPSIVVSLYILSKKEINEHSPETYAL